MKVSNLKFSMDSFNIELLHLCGEQEYDRKFV